MIRSRIAYREITKISPTTEIFTGYRLLLSKNALEIIYKSGYLRSKNYT
ncbi:PH domain-containing protein [Gottfriedia sp. NPDC058432]|nr:PH domain-containing protein [Bacillus sp. FJAT-25509]